MKPEIRLLPIVRTLSVMLTHKCNAECKNCGSLSGPKVGGRANLEMIFAMVDQAASCGFANVVFTGGEPTIYFEDLLRSIEHCKKRKLLTRLVTNGGWCKSKERSSLKLYELIKAGLDEINFSAGDEHQRFIPFEFVVNGIVAAINADIPVHVMIEKVKTRGITKSTLLNHELLRTHPLVERVGISESPWMPLDPFVVTEYEQGHSANSKNIANYSGCDSILQTYVIHPNNEVTSCCGIGARVIPELKSENNFDRSDNGSVEKIIEESEEDFLKLWLRQEGPEKIIEWASTIEPKIKWENMYAHRCQACARLYADPEVRRVINENYVEKVPDVLAKAVLFETSTKQGLPSWISEVSTDSGSRLQLDRVVK